MATLSLGFPFLIVGGDTVIHPQRSAIRKNNFWCHAGLLLVFLLLTVRFGIAQQASTASRIENAEKEPQNWMTFYGNYKGWSYSPLNQITRQNVKQLAPAWAFSAGAPPAVTQLRTGLEATPLVVDGVLYLEGTQNNVYAIDAATGKSLWSYTYKWPDKAITGIKGARGLAFGEGRVYMGTQDNHLVALDAETGKETWNIEVENFFDCLCKITGAPLFVNGKVVTGVAGGGQQHLRGYIDAFDAKTGQRVWHFDTIPSPDQPGGETWNGDTWKMGGGATWLTGTYDPELKLIFWGTGDPSPAYKPDTRPGLNLYATSLLALDADTGKLKWYFQETPHDLYDYDSQPEPVILDLKLAGANRKIILHPSKNGYAYVYDRTTGELLNAFAYGTPNWTKGLDKAGKPIDPVIPEEQKDFVICPSIRSGSRNIAHSAYSPRTGWWYTTDLELCSYLKNGEDNPQEMLNPNVAPNISAFDPATGKRQWTFNTHYYNMSSLLATAGDLIFGGDLGGEAFALDAKTGQKLWTFNTGGRIAAAPVAFSVNGKQYVAISTGGGSQTETYLQQLYPQDASRIPQPGSTLFVFALPEKNK